jgi:hypothetical protein
MMRVRVDDGGNRRSPSTGWQLGEDTSAGTTRRRSVKKVASDAVSTGPSLDERPSVPAKL